MIKVESIRKSFDGLEVLRGATLEVAKGEILALIGRSGYGKSVLLKHVAGLMRPDRGRVLIDGKDIGSLRGKELEQVRSRFGFVFQNGALFDSLTVFENVAFPLKEKTKLSEEEIKSRVLSILDEVGLRATENKYPAQISGGMIRRTALARALVRSPEIMLFDEPTTGLDPIIGRTILNLIDSSHRRFGFTGIIVTHEIPKIFDIVQKVAMLHEGRILIVASPQGILSSSDPVVQQFISGSIEGPIQYH
ncbi:MAG: ATP-binding cassette domain-containing protein [Thermodesulfobacteriota bacterium]|jgi:phospholipid/cholesterol/gamma-HCH transport system ATP-binding protein